jgi:hypothetical protein
LGLPQQCRGGSLDPLFEFGHDPATGPTRWDRIEEFEDNPTRAFEKASPSPEVSGIDGGRNERHRQSLVEGGDTGLIGKARARCDPRPLGEYDDRPSFSGDRPGRRDHAAQRAGAGLTVDRDRAGTRRVPAVKRQ